MAKREYSKNPDRWLDYAKQDLEYAEDTIQRDHPIFRYTCYFSQQSAEKAIKAALVMLQIDFDEVYNLDALAAMLPAGWGLRDHPIDLHSLIEWADEDGSPAERFDDPSEENAVENVTLARKVMVVMLNDIQQHGHPVH